MKKALISLHVAILLAGITAILGKLITIGEGFLVWWRLLFSVAVLWLLWLVSSKTAWPSRRFLVKALAVGGIVGLHWLSFFGSVKYANVSITLVCFSSAGFFSALLEPLLSDKKFSWAEMGLGLLSMAGISLIFHFDSQYKTGILLGVLSAALASLFSIFNKKLVTAADSITLTTFTMSGALVVISAILPWYILVQHQKAMPVGMDWLWLAILSLLCTVWAYMLQLRALHYVSAFTLNLSYNLEPVYGIILAFIIFRENESLSRVFYYGASLIIVAIVLQMLRVQQAHKRIKLQTAL